jgi:putative endonuclease
MKQYWVYILASRSAVLYVGMTNNPERRKYEHKNKLVPGFSAKYNVTLLMWYESFPTAVQAIEAEKRIKGWRRAKKVALIDSVNRTWRDLSEDVWVPPTARHLERSEGSRAGSERISAPEIPHFVRNDDGAGSVAIDTP